MDDNKLYRKIKERLDDDICDLLKKQDLTPTDVEVMGKAVDMLKDIATIEAMDWCEDEFGDGMEEYHSVSGARRGRRSGASRIHYNGTYSGERGRSPITGRYVSRDAYPTWDTSGRMVQRPHEFYEHSGANHGHNVNDRMVNTMENMYDTAETEHERAKIDEVINYIRRMGM